MSDSYAPMCPYHHIPNCGYNVFETGACNVDLAAVLSDICSIVSRVLSMKYIKVFSTADFLNMIDSADKPASIAAVIVLLLAQWKKKQLNNVAVGAVLRACAGWCESHV